jgi:hypothetical protein
MLLGCFLWGRERERERERGTMVRRERQVVMGRESEEARKKEKNLEYKF